MSNKYEVEGIKKGEVALRIKRIELNSLNDYKPTIFVEAIKQREKGQSICAFSVRVGENILVDQLFNSLEKHEQK